MRQRGIAQRVSKWLLLFRTDGTHVHVHVMGVGRGRASYLEPTRISHCARLLDGGVLGVLLVLGRWVRPLPYHGSGIIECNPSREHGNKTVRQGLNVYFGTPHTPARILALA